MCESLKKSVYLSNEYGPFLVLSLSGFGINSFATRIIKPARMPLGLTKQHKTQFLSSKNLCSNWGINIFRWPFLHGFFKASMWLCVFSPAVLSVGAENTEYRLDPGLKREDTYTEGSMKRPRTSQIVGRREGDQGVCGGGDRWGGSRRQRKWLMDRVGGRMPRRRTPWGQRRNGEC